MVVRTSNLLGVVAAGLLAAPALAQTPQAPGKYAPVAIAAPQGGIVAPSKVAPVAIAAPQGGILAPS